MGTGQHPQGSSWRRTKGRLRHSCLGSSPLKNICVLCKNLSLAIVLMLRCVSFLPFRHGRFYRRLAPEASKLQQDLCTCALVLNEEAFAYAGVTTESSSRVWYTYTNFIKTVDS